MRLDNSPVALAKLREVVTQKLGLYPSPERLEEAIRPWINDGSWASIEAYRAYLQSAPATEELHRLAAELCVGETYFFRNDGHFRLLEQKALPDLLRKKGSQKRLRILSAGCSSGEEPYSIAILLREKFPQLASWDLTIVAVDILASSLKRARRGRYREWSLRETTSELRAKYFEKDHGEYRLDASIRKMVSFEQRNLMDVEAAWWRQERFDVVFCRNVLMYFAADAFEAMVQRFGQITRPGGYFLLGHAESLRGMDTGFEPIRLDETFCYQRVDNRSPASRPVSARNTSRRCRGEDIPTHLRPSWMTIIDESSSRIASLSKAAPPETSGTSAVDQGQDEDAPAGADNGRSVSTGLNQARALMEQERFEEALECLEQLDEASGEPEALLLRAVLLTNAQQLERAEAACRRLFEVELSHPGAHYLMALCREKDGDLEAAREHDRLAIEHDSTFATPYLHLGLLARRSGQASQARRHLARAYELLEQEDDARIVLFGGGFGRQALLRICRTEWDLAEADDERR